MSRTLRKLFAAFVLLVIAAVAPAVGATTQSLLLNFVDRVDAFGTDRWTHVVGAGYHRLEVQGDTDTDLDCFVTDRNGNLLGSDTDATDFCIVTWYQSSNRRLSFRIENLGEVYNRYQFRLW